MNQIPKKYFVIDFENTGGSLWSGHKITAYAICIVEFVNNKFQITRKYKNYINPERKIPYFIENLIGITNEFINENDFPLIEQEFEFIESLIEKDMVFVAHCVGVDYGMYNYLYYKKYHELFNSKVLDSCKLAKKFLGYEKGSIGNLAETLDINFGRHHEPDFDVFVAAKILLDSIEIALENEKKMEEFKSFIIEYPTKKHYKLLKKRA